MLKKKEIREGRRVTNIVKKILKMFVDVLTLSVFIVLILIIVAKVKMMVSGKDYFELFGYSVFTVATGSMEPVIKQNDVIIVKKEEDYKVNDITTFISDNAFVTHRIISVRGHDIVTKGDANNAKDAIIKDSDIIGKVVKIIPNGAIWQKVLTSPLTIVMIFATLILFDFAFSYKGNKKVSVVTNNNTSVQVNDSVKINEITQNSDNISANELSTIAENNLPKDNLDYTVRLDLDELMKQIDDHMNGDNDV